MKSLEFLSKSPQETISLARRLAGQLQKGDILCLSGNLGSGKTTFTKGIAKGLGINEKNVNSPTFILMNAHPGKLPLFHFDFYRLENPGEINQIGYEEFLYDEGVAVIEWAERLKNLFPKEGLKIHFDFEGDKKRLIAFAALGKRGAEILRGLKK